ncbi:hypothetical protein QR77_38960 [Streptomyces sp. 150FB]|uniref:ImmA/IrrE family metallo-endopeptidase n=1 Tax=Streptomyces sp. 150FB TaxID=1576605 RepID=UPI0005891F81|nr:hypothetical protein [Streptomyces sp. 150FB]KIF78163.1 hypothetical protein QR77_38960 [Streptomyces sp. 150FB]
MSTLPDFSLSWKWQEPPTTAGGELAATWADLEMSIGSLPPLTVVEDPEAGTVRPYITGSLYPLAEWIAFNWWSLLADARPGTQISQLRFAYRNGVGDARGSWWVRSRRHILRAACDGFRWPDVLFVPEGSQTRVVWMPDGGPDPRGGTRFLTRGNAVVGSDALAESLGSFVDAVLGRLTERDVTGTPLQEEWTAIRATGEEEAEFCRSAARLGLDPYTESAPYAADIVRAARELPETMGLDFFNSVAPDRITDQLGWIERAREVAGTAPAGRPADATVAALRAACADVRQAFYDPGRLENPWHLGYELAHRVRAWAGVPDTDRFETDTLLTYYTEQTPYIDRGLVAYGSRDAGPGPVVVSSRRYTERPRRFLEARALCHFLFDADEDFLIVASHTRRQHLARGFALELLAPAQGIARLLGRPDGLVTAEDVEQIAEDYGAGTIVVEHQLDNRVLAQDFPFEPATPSVRHLTRYPRGATG